MTQVQNLEGLRERYRRIKGFRLSEIDTQVLLIEPVLALSGWDVSDPAVVKRASRSAKKREFDIEVYSAPDSPPRVQIAIESKALFSAEFNMDKINSKNGIGQIKEKQRKAGTLFWANRAGDGTGQMRAYCLNYPQFSDKSSLAVLTKGFDWVIFNNDSFLKEEQLSNRVTSASLAAHSNLLEGVFEDEILHRLKENPT
jgi:hypothetical protein